MMQWFRWYQGTCSDGKMRAVAKIARGTGVERGGTVGNVIALWALLLEDASHEDHRGVCTKDEDYFAAVLDLDDGVAELILGAMEVLQMVSVGHGAITITHWSTRQYDTDSKDPTNAARKRRFRDRNGAERVRNGSGTVRNGSGTVEERPDTDTETDTEVKKPPFIPPEGGATKKRSQKCTLPDSWVPNTTHDTLALKHHADLGLELTKFRDHAEATGRTLKSWDAGFRMWLRNSEKMNGFRSNGSVPSSLVGDVLELLRGGAAGLAIADTRPLAFEELEFHYPEPWARAGPEFRQMQFPALYQVKDKPYELRKEIEQQLESIQRRRLT